MGRSIKENATQNGNKEMYVWMPHAFVRQNMVHERN